MDNSCGRFAGVVFALALLAGCGSDGGPSTSSSRGKAVSVGPTVTTFDPANASARPAYDGTRLDAIVPVFDAGLPADSDDWEEEGISKELRHLEANRFAVKMRDELERTGVFGDVMVAPTAETTGDLYVIGTIKESNGEDVSIEIEVTDIRGHSWSTRTFSHRVKEAFYKNLRNKGKDAYQPMFREAAEHVARMVRRADTAALDEIREVQELRWGAAFVPSQFTQYLEQDQRGVIESPRAGRVRSLAFPSPIHPCSRAAFHAGHAKRVQRLSDIDR